MHTKKMNNISSVRSAAQHPQRFKKCTGDFWIIHGPLSKNPQAAFITTSRRQLVIITPFFFSYKNTFYKNIQAEIPQKIRTC